MSRLRNNVGSSVTSSEMTRQLKVSVNFIHYFLAKQFLFTLHLCPGTPSGPTSHAVTTRGQWVIELMHGVLQEMKGVN